MEHKAVFLKSINRIDISEENTPEFLMLYQQTVLLALKEQNVLNEVQYEFSLSALAKRFRNML